MPRILRIINRLNLGGPTLNAAYLSKYLTPEFETMLVAGMIDEKETSSEFITHELGLKPVFVPAMYRSINPVLDYLAYQKIRKLISDFNPDVVHTHAAKAGTIGRLAAFTSRVPVIVHTFHGHVFHSYFPKWQSNVFVQIERFLAKKTSRVITVSEKLKNELSEVYRICPPDQIEVVPLGFNLTKFSQNQAEKRKKFRNQFYVEEDEIVIVIVGRLVPIKNHDLFLESFKHVTELTTKKIRAFIVGDGDERERLQRKATSLQLDFTDSSPHPRKASLTFTSWIKEIDEVYAGADIVALTSLNEGTPVTLIEAQAAGKPIVTTSVGGIEDIVMPEKTALLVPGASREDFAKKLLELTENDSLRREMTGFNANDIIKHFDYRRLAKAMSDLYKKLLM